MILVHISNKIRRLLIVFGLTICTIASGQNDDYRLHSNVGFNYSNNLKYNFHNWSYYYRSPAMWNKFHLQLDINAYRMLGEMRYVPLLGAYNTFNLKGDYHLRINEKFHLFPFAGIQFILDPQQAGEEGQDLSGIFAVAPIFGISGKYLFNKMDISADFNITQYLDGNWIELSPKFTYTFWQGISANIGIRNILGLSYNGNAEMGFYPFVGLSMYVTRKGEEKEEN